jgi:hypothetical protein
VAGRYEPAGWSVRLRSNNFAGSFISNALAAGVSIFELARIAGTSVRMIEKPYGALLDAGSAIASRLDAFGAQQERAAEEGG